MKRFLFTLLGGAIGVLMCTGLFYLVGLVWGPFYQGEDESTRNFKIYLLSVSIALIAGSILGSKASKH